MMIRNDTYQINAPAAKAGMRKLFILIIAALCSTNIASSASLSSLSVAGYSLSPAFGTDITNYSLTIDEKDSVHIAAEAALLNDTVAVSDTGTFILNYGINTFLIHVTDDSGGEATYTITIQRGVYTVTFADTGLSNIATQTIIHGTAATAPSPPGRDGYTFEGWYDGEAEYDFDTPVTADLTLTAKWKQTPVITFNALPVKVYGDADFILTATSSPSPEPIVFTSSNEAVATISSGDMITFTGAMVTITGVGQTHITATQAGNADYNAATPVTHTLTVNPGEQTITWSAIPSPTYGDADFSLPDTTNRGLVIVYTSDNPSVATVTDNQVHIVGGGTAQITATQAGNTNYNAADSVTHTLTVNKAAQIIVWDSIPSKTYGAADFSLPDTTDMGLTIVYASGNPSVATVTDNQVHIVGGGTAQITATQAGNTNYAAATPITHTLTVNPATQTINWGTIPTQTYGDAAFDLPQKTDKNLNISYESSNLDVATTSGNTVIITGAGQAEITANQAGDANYSAATPETRTLIVNQATQTITWIDIPTQTYGDAAFDLPQKTDKNLNISYASSNLNVATISGNTVTITGAGQTQITATQAGNTNYNAATSVTDTLTVNQATQTITWIDIPTKTYGDTAFSLPSTTDKNLSISYISSNTNVATISGNMVTITGAGHTEITATQAGDANYTAAASVAHTLTVAKAAQTIVWVTIPSPTYGDAAFDLPLKTDKNWTISYASSDANVATISGNTVTIKGAGQTQITATQAGDTNYNAATSVTHTLTVNKADQNIVWDSIPSKTYGDVDFDLPDTTDMGLTIVYASGNTAVATVTDNHVHIVGAGTAQITATQSGNTNYNAATSVTHTLTVHKADQTIGWDSIPSKTYGDADFDLPDTTSRGLTIVYTSGNLSVATVTDNHVHIVGAGTAQITATQAGNTNYNAATSVTHTLTVNKADQTIGWDSIPSKTYGDVDFDLPDTTDMGLTIVYTSKNHSVATVTGNYVHIVGAGTAQITATQPGNANYNAADSVTHTLTVNKADQTIVWDSIPSKTYGDVDFDLPDTTDMGWTIVYASGNPSVATVTDNHVHILGAGTAQITATQAGNTNYNAADSVTHTLTVNKAYQTIGWDSIPSKTYGDADFDLPDTTDMGLTIVYASGNPSVATVADNRVHIVGGGTVQITATQAGNTNYNAAAAVTHTLTVNKADQTITWDSIPSKTYGDANFSLPDTTNRGLTIVYTSGNTSVATVADNRVHIVGAGTAQITATQAGNTNYNAAAAVTHTLTVNKADQTITWDSIPSKTYGDANFSLQPSRTDKNLTISYESLNTSVATISGNRVTITGAGQTYIIATQAGNTNYNAADSVTHTLTVNKANQTIVWNSIPSKTYGDVDFSLPDTTNSGLTIVYASGNPSVATVTGNYMHIVGAGTAQITATQAGDANYNAADSVTHTLTVSKANQTIVSSSISKTYGEAEFDLPDTTNMGLTIVYASDNTSVATVTGNRVHLTGADTARITATQAGDLNHNPASVTRLLTVKKSDSAITFADLPMKTYGNAPFALVATSIAPEPITFISSDTSIVSISDTTATIHKAGVVSITASQAGGAATRIRALTIDKATVTITVNDTSMFYGDATPTSFTYQYSGFVNGETEAVLDSFPTFVCNYNGGNVGDYAIKPNLNQSYGNYKFSFQDGTLTVNKANAGVIAFWKNDTTVTYGPNLRLELPSSTDKGQSITYTSDNADVATTPVGYVNIHKIGTAHITATVADTVNYDAVTPVTRTLTVTKSDAGVIDFWGKDTTVTYEVNSLSLPSTTDKGRPITYTSDNADVATTSSNNVYIHKVGTVHITATVAVNENYNAVTPVTHALTVNKSDAGVIDFWKNDTAVIYGEVSSLSLPSKTDKGRTITYTGDNPNVATTSSNNVSIHKAGTVHITATVAVNANYTAVTPVTRTLIVNKIDAGVIDFWGKDTTITYGEVSSFNLPSTTDKGRPITYTSDNPNVASTSGNSVRINKVGTAHITATVADNENYTAVAPVTRTLTVNKANAEDIDFWKNDTTITYGEVRNLSLPRTTDKGRSITYTSDNPSVASTSGNVVNINKVGTAHITATVTDNENFTAVAPVTRTVTVTSVAVTGVTLTDTTATLSISTTQQFTTQQLTAIVTPATATDKTVTWSSSNTSIATVSASGEVTAKAAGTATITATTADGGKQATCMVTVTVSAPPVIAPVIVTYTVAFNSRGGSTVASQTVNSGATASKPADPEREGYTFAGWFYELSYKNEWFENELITRNITLYAQWTEDSPEESAPATAIETVTVKLQLYPNPTTDVVHIKNANGAEVKVYNLSGECLQSTTESRIDLSAYPSGIYLLKIGGQTLKVVKQ
ncbi:Ig-like domain-containing protein [Candidatus Symbiothrix dinenymphae]|uniref:Ig-like domain-containing protein n=1 Tax=Candidatus Symbiothrix dinenymphae TaxID=467085 RepID=UPI0006C18A33|nr:Ig-like domain-containing protein [Candidatus Symbiothrix dinenymphae]GAP72021.1 endoglucanase [Candidatus Symbiothrix dinenymphae]